MASRYILDELQKLPLIERLSIIEVALQLVREDLHRQVTQQSGAQQTLAQAAETLLHDYTHDAELTAFTALDGEDVYA